MTKTEAFRRPRFAGLHYAVIQALHWALLAIYYAFGATYLYATGLSSFGTGLVLAVAGLLSAALQPPIATRADRAARGAGAVRRWCLALLIPSCALMAALWLFAMPPWLHIGVFVLVWMLIMALMFLFNSLAMEYVNAGYPLNYGVGRAIGSLSFALGAYFYGRYIARFGAAALLPLASSLCALLLLALLLWRSPPIARRDAAPETTQKSGFVRRYPRFIALVVSAILCLTPYCTVCNFLVRFVEPIGGGSVEVGTAIMIAALCEVPIMFVSLLLCRRFGAHRLMILSAAMLSAKMLMIVLARSVAGVYIAELFQLLSYPLFLCVSVYYVNALVSPQDRVRGQAVMTLAPLISGATGALLGGFLLDALGVRTMLALSLAISAVGSALMIVFTQRTETPAQTAVRSDP